MTAAGAQRAVRLPAYLSAWLKARGWTLRPHQRAMLGAARAGDHALLVADTGAGKTLAGFLASIIDIAARKTRGDNPELHTLYISPLKALGQDVLRNLQTPLAEMRLDITVETRTGDTPANRRQRQKEKPPNILITTPESLSLLLSQPDSFAFFAGLNTVIVDEVHAFGHEKRGDLLQLSLARLQTIVPDMRRVALSATVADTTLWRRWLSPDGRAESVTLVQGMPGKPPVFEILVPEGRVPWSGHSATYASQQVMDIIAAHRTTLVFSNTRGLAELTFNSLWAHNPDNLPIGIHHGSLDVDVRRRAEAAMADGRLRALVATASVDLGVDWGDIDCVVQMGAPKGASRLIQRVGRSNHRLDEASKAVLVPGNRFEYLEAQAAIDAVQAGERDVEVFRPGALDVLAQHILGMACAAPFDPVALHEEVTTAFPYRDLPLEAFQRVIDFVSTGGYALRVYDRYRRLVPMPDGRLRIATPAVARQFRMNAGIIVEAQMVSVRFRNGRRLGQVEEYFAGGLMPGDRFYFAGLGLEVEGMRESDLIVRATSKPAGIASYTGTRMALTTNLARRVRAFLADPDQWQRFPSDVHEWLAIQAKRSRLPGPDDLLIETFPHDRMHYTVLYPFEGWNAHQSLGMLLTKRMERMGLQPMGFQATDYALAIWSRKPVTDPTPLLSPDILNEDFVDWVNGSHLLRRAFREVAVIGGLVDRVHPGQRKSGRQVTFSTDLIFDVLRKHEPDHVLLQAAWNDARQRLSDVDRLGTLIETAAQRVAHVALDRISPFAVPVLVLIGRESVAQEATDDAFLQDMEKLVARAVE